MNGWTKFKIDLLAIAYKYSWKLFTIFHSKKNKLTGLKTPYEVRQYVWSRKWN